MGVRIPGLALVVLSLIASVSSIRLMAAPKEKPAKSEGILLTEVVRGNAGDRSGLQKGDILLSWSWRGERAARDSQSGTFAASMDLDSLENSLAAQGQVRIQGMRLGKPFEVTMSKGKWALPSRPNFAGGDLDAFEAAKKVFREGGGDFKAVEDFAEDLGKRGRYSEAAWLWCRIGDAHVRARRKPESMAAVENAKKAGRDKVSPQVFAQLLNDCADICDSVGDNERKAALHREAIEIWKKTPAQAGYGWALHLIAEDSFVRGDLPSALEGFRKSLAALESSAPGSLLAALSVSRIGEIHWSKGELDGAQEYFQRAYSMVEKFAPEGAELVGFANNLGKVQYRRGDLPGAEAIFRKGVEIVEKNEPGSLLLARSLNGLGLIVTDAGDLPEAEKLLKKAVAIWEKEAPGNPNGWRPYQNLGNVYLHRGDLAKAEACYTKSVEMVKKLAPDSLQEAAALGNLAVVAEGRSDGDSAEVILRKVLEITEKQAPGSPDLARCHEYLGRVEQERGKTDAAMGHYGQATKILREKAPGSVQLANGLMIQGAACLEGDRGDEAVPLLQEALSLFEAASPRSPKVAAVLTYLGVVALKKGDFSQAMERLNRSVEILDQAGIGSTGLAEAMYYSGRAYRMTGKKSEARAFLERALAVVESLGERLGGSSHDRANFREKFANYYREYQELLLDMGDPKEAFRTVERWRAMEFLQMLAGRDLDLGKEIPPELERERRLATADVERAAESLSGEPASQATGKDQAEVRLHAAQKRLEDVRLKTLQVSRDTYDLRYPHPVTVEDAFAALEPGTLLLEYAVGPEKSFLFALGPEKGEFSVVPLAADGQDLRRQVERFRGLIREAAASPLGSVPESEIRLLASRLSGTLLGPVSQRVARAKRLLVVPDSALYYLPFSALAAPPAGAKRKGASGGGPFTFLVESKPVHTIASATVYARLIQRRHGPEALTLEAFGDPDYGKILPSGLWRGGERTPLPGTRREVELIRDVVGSGRLHLGADATVRSALAIPKDTRIVHFACHGFTDEIRPLESALALSASGGKEGEADDGLLKAWKIYESMRVDADLVTLSACETGLGKVFQGEGLVGLTRAFQYAGARTVLASLWPVSDEGTAELMRSFYASLKGGATKDEALRVAQLHLLRGNPPDKKSLKGSGIKAGALSSPFHWAAFQLVGDWR